MRRMSCTVMGREVAFWEIGADNVNSIVMLHGFRGNHRGLTSVAKQLTGFRVVLPDRPGYGESTPLDGVHSVPRYAEWLEGFVTSLGLRSFVTWGHSFGGLIALVQAVDGRVKPKAVLTVSLGAVRRDPLRFLTDAYYASSYLLPHEWSTRWLLSRTVERIGDRFLFSTPAQREFSALQRDIDRPGLRADTLRQEYLTSLRLNVEDYARAIEVPFLVMGGVLDPLVSIQRLRRIAAMAKKGQLAEVPQQGHMIPVEDPRLTSDLTRKFLVNEVKFRPGHGRLDASTE